MTARLLKSMGVALIVTCVLSVCAAGWLALRFIASKPVEVGNLMLETAPGRAQVVRDAQGVAHIFGDNDASVFFALGFTHASERFFQMDLIRRYVRGELADLFGEDFLRVDARTRTLGYAREAESLAENLEEDTRAAIAAYVAGVNARVNQRDVAPEYALLRRQPRPWSIVDTAAVVVSFADDLAAGVNADKDRLRLRGILSNVQLAQFMAPFPAWAPTTLKDKDLRAANDARDEPLPDVFSQADNQPGSNAWVVSGARSQTGKPLLANDPHLSLSSPSIWYHARLNLSFGPVIGVTTPGAPFVILGRNAHGAWGFTNTGFDVVDLLERDGAALRIEERSEVVSIDGGESSATIIVRETTEGPVLDRRWFDLDGVSDDSLIVRRSTFGYPGNKGIDAAYAVMRSTGWDSFVEAGRGFTIPMQNQHYAGVDGTIGYTTAGLLPIRDPGSGEWLGFVPYEQLPRVKNPGDGIIASGNNLVASDAYPYSLPGKYAVYRAPRIEALLSEREKHSIESFAEMQMDVRSEWVQRLLPSLLQAAPQSSLGQGALARLRNWDGRLTSEGSEALIVSAWLRELSDALWSDELGSAAKFFRQPRRAFLERVLTGGAGAWCDNTDTPAKESCATTSGAALDAAIETLAGEWGNDIGAWRWGAAHRADFDHPMGDLPLVGPLFESSAAVPGDGSTINVAHFTYRSGNFDVMHGASMRAIYDLSDLNKSRFMHAPGQSGHPLSPHHSDLAERWAAGDYFEIRDDWSWEAPPAGANVLRLIPAEAATQN